MISYKEIHGDLIQLALDGHFDVIAHGCNCRSLQKAGIAAQMHKVFKTSSFTMEQDYWTAIERLGNIDYENLLLDELGGKATEGSLTVVNAYTQYDPGPNLDYTALRMCLKKINMSFHGERVGLPQIGCGIGGGNWPIVKQMIQRELKDCRVTVVIYKPSNQLKLPI